MGTGVVVGTIKHLAPDEREQLTVETMSTEALTTSEIEGEILDRASVQSSNPQATGAFDRKPSRRAGRAGDCRDDGRSVPTFAEPLTDEMLFAWHRTLVHGRGDLRDIGHYRTGNEPMEVVSGAIHDPRVHFEAPPSSDVPGEMARFAAWFSRTAFGGSESLPALTRAGIAHLYFVSIHPFEDGNGRIGRAIAEKALAQSLGHDLNPVFRPK
jgi:Fic family protein